MKLENLQKKKVYCYQTKSGKIKSNYGDKGEYFKEKDIESAVNWLKLEVRVMKSLSLEQQNDVIKLIKRAFLDIGKK